MRSAVLYGSTASYTGKAAPAAPSAASAASASAAALAAISVSHKGATYPLAVLQAARPGDGGVFAGIDFAQKELCLSESSFLTVFGMTFDDFLKLPEWKRGAARKKVGLF